MKKDNLLTCACLIFLGFGLGSFISSYYITGNFADSVLDARKQFIEYKEYKETYRERAGVVILNTKKTLNYYLRSFDGGRNWYAIKNTDKDSKDIIILGEVEKVYPGLQKYLMYLDILNREVVETKKLNKSINPFVITNIEFYRLKIKDNSTDLMEKKHGN